MNMKLDGLLMLTKLNANHSTTLYKVEIATTSTHTKIAWLCVLEEVCILHTFPVS